MIRTLTSMASGYYVQAKNEVNQLWSEKTEVREKARYEFCSLISRISIAAAFLPSLGLLISKAPPHLAPLLGVIHVFSFIVVSHPAVLLNTGLSGCYLSVAFLSRIPVHIKANQIYLVYVAWLHVLGSLAIVFVSEASYERAKLFESNVGVVPAMAHFLCRQWTYLDQVLGLKY